MVWIDGASRNNPGEAGCGVSIVELELSMVGSNLSAHPKGRIEAYKYLGVATNNVAEYNALLYALEILEGRVTDEDVVTISTDSLLVCNHVNKKWACRKPHLRELLTQCVKKLEKFKEWTIGHVKRDRNQDADKLANIAVDKKASNIFTY